MKYYSTNKQVPLASLREAVIKGIHSKYRGEPARIRFTAQGFEAIDTVLPIASSIPMSVSSLSSSRTSR